MRRVCLNSCWLRCACKSLISSFNCSTTSVLYLYLPYENAEAHVDRYMHGKIVLSQDASDDLCSASVQEGHSWDSTGVCQHMLCNMSCTLENIESAEQLLFQDGRLLCRQSCPGYCHQQCVSRWMRLPEEEKQNGDSAKYEVLPPVMCLKSLKRQYAKRGTQVLNIAKHHAQCTV